MFLPRALPLLALLAAAAGRPRHTGNLARTPPMGWMSWEMFRCDTDCAKQPNACINDNLYETMTDALVSGGFLAAGYDGIHLDDCWMLEKPGRDPTTGQLRPDPTRFPKGFKALGDYMHAKDVKFAIYTAESPTTCAGYPASAEHEKVDADTFAAWGVDYLKVDGCGHLDYYQTGYPAMGAALQNSGRDIVYSCSWPAYLGENESTKPYQTMIASGCNLWRNYRDIQCRWSSLADIIDHYGDWGDVLAQYAGPGHWNDMDMLLIGNSCINDDEGRTQMAIWSIYAAPLIMGNDIRNISQSSTDILTNKDAIAVNQDPLGQQGGRISAKGDTEIWARHLENGDVAVALYNKNGAGTSNATCPQWNETHNGYQEACGGPSGDIAVLSRVTVQQAKDECCQNPLCAGFSFTPSTTPGEGVAYLKANTNCGVVHGTQYQGFSKPNFVPGGQNGTSANITLNFIDVGFSGAVSVYDIWSQKSLGNFMVNFTASVPFHGTGFYRMSFVQ